LDRSHVHHCETSGIVGGENRTGTCRTDRWNQGQDSQRTKLIRACECSPGEFRQLIGRECTHPFDLPLGPHVAVLPLEKRLQVVSRKTGLSNQRGDQGIVIRVLSSPGVDPSREFHVIHGLMHTMVAGIGQVLLTYRRMTH